VDAVDPAHVEALVAEMRRDLEAAFPGEPDEWVATAELRYGGQSWEVEVALADARDDQSQASLDLAALRARFEAEHERLYGVRGQPGAPVEIRAVRLAALGPVPAAEMAIDAGRAGVRSKPDTAAPRSVYVDGGLVDAPVRTRASVGVGAEAGPLLIDEYDTTVVVSPGWSVRRDEATASLILERSA
jgi:N-methylhydantoinase A